MTRFYGADDIDKFIRDMQKYSIGMDEWFHRMGAQHETKENYPPYNLIKQSSVEFKLEVALAGFQRKDLNVFTENNKLFIEGTKANKEEAEYVHKGLATRDFTRVWTLADDVIIEHVDFVDGILSVELRRIIPEHQKKRVYL